MSGIEPPQAPLITVYTVYTYVEGVKEVGDLFYVHFNGSRESIAFPVPAFAVNDKVKITFEKVPDAKP